jgi:uncharacterized membrane-anchored protein
MRQMGTKVWIAAACALLFLSSGGALVAQEERQQRQPEQPSEAAKVVQSIKWQKGPGSASLGDVADIKVPDGFVFAGAADTIKLMDVMGNIPSHHELGLLANGESDWFVVYEFENIGYVRDDEKNSLDADVLLKSIRQSTDRGNKIRKKRGLPALLNIDWITKPHYDETTHNLEWTIKGEDDTGDTFVNHNTRLLGRKGMMVVTLVADPESIATVLPEFRTSLKDFAFKAGNTYAEFRSGDKLAGYGLTALVAGGAAAVAVKTGLFKYLGKFLVFILAGLAAFFKKIWAKISRFFRSEDKPSSQV